METERDVLPIVKIGPTKPSSIPVIGSLLNFLGTHTEAVTRFTMPESRAKKVADDAAAERRGKGLNATGETIPSANRTF